MGWIHTGTMPGRLGATIEQVGKDLTTGIERNDPILTNAVRGVRNGMIATWHLINGVIPSIANSLNGQQYSVVERQGGFDGTVNAARKVVHTKGVVGRISAIAAEATDGPVDDLLSLTGGAQFIIVPETRSSLKNVLTPQSVR
jgi:hypothetical protein